MIKKATRPGSRPQRSLVNGAHDDDTRALLGLIPTLSVRRRLFLYALAEHPNVLDRVERLLDGADEIRR